MSSFIVVQEGDKRILYRDVTEDFPEVPCPPILIPIIWNVSSDTDFSVGDLITRIGYR